MSPSANVLSIQSLEDLKATLARFGGDAREALNTAEPEIRRTLDWLQERVNYWQREVNRRRAILAEAQRAYNECRSHVERDPKTGATYRPPCTGEWAAVVRAQAYLREAEVELQHVQNWMRKVQQAVADYHRQSQRLATLLGNDLPKASTLLGQKIATLQSYVGMSAPSIGSVPAAQTVMAGTLISMLADLGGGHGSRYQAARQQFLRSLVDDPNQPKYVRGWIKQELNRLERISQAPNLPKGQTPGPDHHGPPGGNKRHLRGIPGLDVGHRFPDIDLPENFRLEDAWINRGRPARARKLGLWDKLR
jgi:hypothetical protein